jgi:oxygen-independent coproporphyrinogen-3 oxidase
MTGFNPARGFGVYIHWPYCARICPYCDFNVYAAKSRDTAPLSEGILRDLEAWRARTGPRQVDAIFFGGGTPSLMSGRQVARTLQVIDQLWGVRARAEVTLEANPDDVARFSDFAAAGVNRLSLGLQSLDDVRLKFLGRTHTAASALAALAQAQGKFRSISIDLIYSLPNQTAEDWRAELGRVAALGADHLSLYELSIEPGAAFFQAVKRKDWSPLDEEGAANLYEVTQDLTEAAGYHAYEISNHARGADHRSVHNTIYWSCGDWAGVGPGAHGRITSSAGRFATEAAESPGRYLALVKEKGLGWDGATLLDTLAQARERVSMGLRVSDGFPVRDIEDLGLALETAKVDAFTALGLIANANDRIALTRSGRLIADRIAAEISP